jgi:MjaI-like restriction endonuclease
MEAKSDTGGPLNAVTRKYGLNAPQRTVPVMRLIKAHQPKTCNELRDLIDGHYKGECLDCGIKSKGTIESFGDKLYHAQMTEWNEHRFTREQCCKWMDDLFVVNSLRGNTMEAKAIDVLKDLRRDLQFERCSGTRDEKDRIDIVCKKKTGEIVCGIQVKPLSFLSHKSEIEYHEKRFSKWGHPACFFFYDNRELSFSDEQKDAVCKFISAIAS